MKNRFPIKYYLFNCFLLTLPVMAWNILLTDNLPAFYQPAIFWKEISPVLAIAENTFRMAVFGLTICMPLSIVSRPQKAGLVLYIAGILIYFASWTALIYLPNSGWSNNIWGFMAPAYTPLLWLLGIAFIGNRFYFGIPYRNWIFIACALAFLVFHNLHTFIIFNRTQ